MTANGEKTKQSLMTKAAALLLILVLPFNIIGIVEALLSYRSAAAGAEQAVSHSVELYSALLDHRISNVDTFLYDMVFTEPAYGEFFGHSEERDHNFYKYRLFHTLKTRMTIANMTDEIFLFGPGRNDYLKLPNYSGPVDGKYPYMEYMEKYDSASSGWFLVEDENRRLLLRIFYDKNYQAYYGACISLEDFAAELEEALALPTLSCAFRTASAPKTAGRIVLNTKVRPGVYLTVDFSARELFKSIDIVQIGLFLFFLLYLLLVPVLIFLMRRYVGQPLSVLNDAHGQLKLGNEDYRIRADANSGDFARAYASFNDMAGSLQMLQTEVVEKEKANKQLMIDFLQLQIRPHFLLNSFNVLYTLIQNGQKAPAHDMVLFLSDYFRYLFRSGSELQLFSKEMRLIVDYLSVTKIYYPNAFTVSYLVDPILSLMRVPPLLLHSFVENIIAHALLPDRTVHIVFSGEYEDGVVTFYISDDGKGMDPAAICAINNVDALPVDDGKNVGIKNSIRRLKYYYGENASACVESELHVGTTFTLTIPYDLEEKPEIQSEDRKEMI